VSLSHNAWQQLKNKTADDLIRAAVKDGFVLDEKVRTERVYRHKDGRRFSLHYHKGSQTYGASLMKALLDDIGWIEDDMRRLKLIK
jgi:hypothetical protein